MCTPRNGSASISTGPSMRDSYSSAPKTQAHYDGDGHDHGRASYSASNSKSDYK